ncbi:hypothetical protein FOZ63_020376 [Perkinsus olseni]|uniref:Uncharacterized protein n=1 Tax=Perkinsus olseni TaxID=32597 RepID=A0A7J6UEJ2_PEROL|nr:hypothetical protein FOZ63_020376 [Perkinsus olseni]
MYSEEADNALADEETGLIMRSARRSETVHSPRNKSRLSSPRRAKKEQQQQGPSGRRFSSGSVKEWMQRLRADFGDKILIWICVSQHLAKGLVLYYMLSTMDYLLRSYWVSGPRLQILTGVVFMPWVMKPIFGVLSDMCPIFGYHKQPYILVSAILGIAAFVLLCANPVTDAKGEYLPLAQRRLSLPSVVLAMFVCTVFVTVQNLLTEARYGPHAPFFPCLVPAALFIPLIFFNFLGERKVGREEVSETYAALRRQGYAELVMLACLMLACTTVTNGVGFQEGRVVAAAYTGFVSTLVLVVLFGITLTPVIAKFTVFSIIQASLAVSIEGGAFYFFTDTAEQFPGGPNFSPVYYTTVLGVVSNAFSIFGVLIYWHYMRRWTFRNLLILANALHITVALLQTFVFLRWNLAVGISDKVFVLGGTSMLEVTRQWMWMPTLILTSKLCPQGMESTMFALLAGCASAGYTMAKYIGAFVLHELNVRPVGAVNEGHQFDNLWKAAVLSASCPLLTLFLLPFCIPNARQTAHLPTGNSVVEGSLWRRLRGCNDDHSESEALHSGDSSETDSTTGASDGARGS